MLAVVSNNYALAGYCPLAFTLAPLGCRVGCSPSVRFAFFCFCSLVAGCAPFSRVGGDFADSNASEAVRDQHCKHVLHGFRTRVHIGNTSGNIRDAGLPTGWIDDAYIHESNFQLGLPILDSSIGESVFYVELYPRPAANNSEYSIVIALTGREKLTPNDARDFLGGVGDPKLTLTEFAVCNPDGIERHTGSGREFKSWNETEYAHWPVARKLRQNDKHLCTSYCERTCPTSFHQPRVAAAGIRPRFDCQ